jgi:DNA-binding beta-propeller fold protein YncE
MPRQWTSPVYDSGGDRLLAVETPFAPRGFGRFEQVPTLWTAKRADGWNRRKGPAAPAGTTELFIDGQGAIVAVGDQGVFRLSHAETSGDKPSESFIPAGPNPPMRLQAPLAFALNVATGEIAVRSQNTVTVLERNSEGMYTKKRESEIAGGESAVLAFSGSTLLAGLSDGRVLILDATTLEVKQELSPAGETPPRFAFAAPNGRWFMVLFHNRELWLFDTRAGKPANVSFRGQGDISAAAFSGNDRILVTDRSNRVTSYQLDPFQTEDRRAPALTPIERVYHYAIVPIYTVFPKPGELDNIVSYLLTDQETVAGPNSEDLSQRRIKIDVYGPVWSSLAFLTVVLTFTCLYVRRTDF